MELLVSSPLRRAISPSVRHPPIHLRARGSRLPSVHSDPNIRRFWKIHHAYCDSAPPSILSGFKAGPLAVVGASKPELGKADRQSTSVSKHRLSKTVGNRTLSVRSVMLTSGQDSKDYQGSYFSKNMWTNVHNALLPSWSALSPHSYVESLRTAIIMHQNAFHNMLHIPAELMFFKPISQPKYAILTWSDTVDTENGDASSMEEESNIHCTSTADIVIIRVFQNGLIESSCNGVEAGESMLDFRLASSDVARLIIAPLVQAGPLTTSAAHTIMSDMSQSEDVVQQIISKQFNCDQLAVIDA